MTAEHKVFGLGLSRTGTTSLGRALCHLDVRTIHYPFDEETYRQLTRGDYKLRALDHRRGVVDISVAPYYPQLDRAFPGSKFILTTRDKESWLRSVARHFERVRRLGTIDPQFKRFTEFICACVYGVHEFNAERFSYVYDTHVRNVLHYFRNRADDLLVMDVASEEKWKLLCRFLRRPIPSVAFPSANSAGSADDWVEIVEQSFGEIRRCVGTDAVVLILDGGYYGDIRLHKPTLCQLPDPNLHEWNVEKKVAEALDRGRNTDAKYIAVINSPSLGDELYVKVCAELGVPAIHSSEKLSIFNCGQ